MHLFFLFKLMLIQLPEVDPEIQAGLRQFLHRMTVCLGEELLPFVPLASQVLLKSSSIQSLSEYIPLINQIIAKFKVIYLNVFGLLFIILFNGGTGNTQSILLNRLMKLLLVINNI